MMVTFISQCEKKALKKTRRVLDAFANRIGDNTWQTVITKEGLDAVKKLLRRTASKSTAVSCHWIRSRARSQFLWVVGNKREFNSEGVVAVNKTEKAFQITEGNWKYLPAIKALSAVAALLHDWGKATDLFQAKLDPDSKDKFKGDPVRHEWISTLLLHGLIQQSDGTDDSWLQLLINQSFEESQLKEQVAKAQQSPLKNIPDAARLVAWLIVSHHRLPTTSTSRCEVKQGWLGEPAVSLESVLSFITREWGYENRYDEAEYQKRIKQCFEFSSGLLSQSNQWREQLKRWAIRLRACLPLINHAIRDDSYRNLLHHARLGLMLGDHYFSSQANDANWINTTGLFANTERETKQLKQKLDEHLVGVCESAQEVVGLLPSFERNMQVAENVSILKEASPAVFSWQDKAVKAVIQWREAQTNLPEQFGFFAVNMASTGCGKTFANAKVMRSLSVDGESLRYALALGLRTLTLQTGDEYRERIFKNDEEARKNLAVLIGSRAIAELHQKAGAQVEAQSFELSGSESQEPLLDEYIDYDCDIPEQGFATVLTRERDRQFLHAPVLVCTIDHLMAATETKRGGRYILPCLRLMSSDLVIDEIDDFTGDDLIAIGRIIHLAGMLGRKVMISSATIPPDLAEGYFNAYQEGWKLFAKSRDNINTKVGCAWIDENKSEVSTVNVSLDNPVKDYYRLAHQVFINKRVIYLKKQAAKRKAEIIDCFEALEQTEFDEDEEKQQSYFSVIFEAAKSKHHKNYTIDRKTGIAVSFGVVRVANIKPCVALARFLLEQESENFEIKTMAYHSRQVMLLRHEQEKHLDAVLKRKEMQGEQPEAFSNKIIRKHLDNTSSKNVIFILVATPVEEVGRDHDFDWAIVEPSSYRSIVQLAGRVRRHRKDEVKSTNVGIMQYNWKAFKNGDDKGEKYFNKPGYEEMFSMASHNISNIMNTEQIIKRLDAIPRISKNSELDYENSLADLEHHVTHMQLTRYENRGPKCLQGFLNEHWFLTAFPQILTPFRQSEPSINLFLVYNPKKENCFFAEKDDQGFPVDREDILRISRIQLSEAQIGNLWFERDYQQLLAEYIQETTLPTLKRVSLRYGELNFNHQDNKEYEYNDQLGLFEKEREV